MSARAWRSTLGALLIVPLAGAAPPSDAAMADPFPPDAPVVDAPVTDAENMRGDPDAPVADAAMRGDIEAVRSLLRSGADVNAAQGDGMTALHWAAQRGDAELAEILVFAGANGDAGTRIGHYTPLHIASRVGSIEVVRVLLDAGSDVAAVTTNSGATPLHLAAASGKAEVVRALVEHGADIEAREAAWQQPPLTFAAANNRVEAIRVLLEVGADPNATSRAVDVIEMAEADEAAQDRLMEVLADFKRREGGGPAWQPTPSQVQAAIQLSRQIQRKWPDVPQDEGEDGAEEEGEEGEEPTEEAEETQEEEGEEEAAAGEAAPSHEQEGEQREEAAADSAQADEDGDEEGEEEEEEPRPMSYAEQVERWGGLTPLLHAVRQGHAESAMLLLDGGADVDLPSAGDHTTPLLMASLNGQWDLALKLLERGADPNIASLAGTTPLYAVLEREWAPRASYAHPIEHEQQQTTHIRLMEALLEAGADPDARLNRHLWYMEYTFGVLRGSGIHLKGATPFWRAAYALDVEAMQLLRAYGAGTDIPTMKPAERRSEDEDEEEEEEQEEGEPATEEEAATTEGEEVAAAEEEGAAAEAAESETVVAEEEGAADEEGEEQEPADEERGDEDLSGLPPVPTDGPAIHPIHAASGVGYGQSFAGNAHRYVPGGWLPAVQFLVEKCGADVNARDANGYTALHHAASRGDNEMILYLVEHGADITVVSRSGQTVADMANGPVQRVRPFPETVALLEQLGSKNNHNCVSCE